MRCVQLKDNGAVIDFDRLLLGRVESRDFVVKNACQVGIQRKSVKTWLGKQESTPINMIGIVCPGGGN